jgi:tRNA nucleotidyltransferase (CCA-adding enzyme)
MNLIPAAIPGIDLLTPQRVRHELDLILEEENSGAMLGRLAELRILKQVHPALKWNKQVARRFTNGMNARNVLSLMPLRRSLGWTLWLMDTPAPELKEIEKRLHFDSRLRKMVLAASDLFARVDSLREKKTSQYTAILDNIPLRVVQAVCLAVPPGAGQKILQNYLTSWRHIKPMATGHTLLKRGIPPGPRYQSILNRLREARLDGEIKTDAEEQELLDKLINPSSQTSGD